MQNIYKNFLTPKNIQVESLSPVLSRITLEPLERGFGHTLGSALRRILLSSMPGASVVEVNIENVLHEYSSIDGVSEDVIDILLNLKGLSIKLNEHEEVILSLHKVGQGAVTAADISLDHDVEILNPDHVIAHITSETGEINMKLKVRSGRGYQPASVRKQLSFDENREVGSLLVDASFSPVKRVSYEVENARVEQRKP
tara:strand:+ start:99 stop:695 length:597 start_codon:yes stop_codon:yes gene_type:complete